MIGVNNFYGQYRKMINRRQLHGYYWAESCFCYLCTNRTGSYTCDVSVSPDGKVYSFDDEDERKQFCNDNGAVSGKIEIFVLGITHNTTGRPTAETEWGYRKAKNDGNLPLFGTYEEQVYGKICLDICYVIKNKKRALTALGQGNLNYKGKRIWQESMLCVRIPKQDGEPYVPYYVERPEDEPDGTPTAIIKRKKDGSKETIRNLIVGNNVY